MVPNSEIQKLKIPELISYIVNEYHFPLREMIVEVKKQLSKLESKFHKNEIDLSKELFKQFDSEIIKHIDLEEQEYFPAILNLHKKKAISKKNLRKFLHSQEIEHHEIDNYLIGIRQILQGLKGSKVKNLDKVKEIINTLYFSTMDHVYVENNYLNKKVQSLLEEAK